MAPAIKLAREGFPLYTRLRGGMEFKKNAFLKTPDAARVFLVNGEVPALGYVIKQPELAASLEIAGRAGRGRLLQGRVRAEAGRRRAQLGGNWTEADLANYKVVERPPVVGHYRGARIVSGSPPTSGGIALIDALNILDGFELAKVDKVTRTHLIVEAMRRVHRDRAVYLGDPDFVEVPVEQAHQSELRRGTARLDPHGSRHAERDAARSGCAGSRSFDHAFLGDRRQGQHGRGHHHAQFLLRLRPHGAGHRHPAEQPDGRLLRRSPACRMASSSSAPTPMPSRRGSARCPRPRPPSSKGRTA